VTSLTDSRKAIGTNSNAAHSLLFPARGTTDKPFNGWGKSKAALDEKSGVTDWTLHDLRRTFATKLAELDVAPHVIERILNHVTGTLSPIALVYNRASYLPKMRAAMALYEQHLTGLLATG
jgi:integrase